MSNRPLALKERPAPGARLYTVAGGAAPLPGPSVRWACSHHAGRSEIEAYVPVTDGLEVIATAHALTGVDARATAELIVNAVNAYQRSRPLIEELLGALKLCLQSNGLSWEAQREAEIVVRKMEKIVL